MLPTLPRTEVDHYTRVLGFSKTVEILNDIDPATCHDAAHIVGELAFREVGNIAKSFELCTESCMSGCIHGALLGAVNDHTGGEEHELEHVSLDSFAEDLPSICTSDTSDPALEGTCIHGVGHALMSLSTHLDDGLALCDGYADERKRYFCETEVFMEMLVGGTG